MLLVGGGQRWSNTSAWMLRHWGVWGLQWDVWGHDGELSAVGREVTVLQSSGGCRACLGISRNHLDVGLGPLLGVALLGQSSEQKIPEVPASLGHPVVVCRIPPGEVEAAGVAAHLPWRSVPPHAAAKPSRAVGKSKLESLLPLSEPGLSKLLVNEALQFSGWDPSEDSTMQSPWKS